VARDAATIEKQVGRVFFFSLVGEDACVVVPAAMLCCWSCPAYDRTCLCCFATRPRPGAPNVRGSEALEAPEGPTLQGRVPGSLASQGRHPATAAGLLPLHLPPLPLQA